MSEEEVQQGPPSHVRAAFKIAPGMIQAFEANYVNAVDTAMKQALVQTPDTRAEVCAVVLDAMVFASCMIVCKTLGPTVETEAKFIAAANKQFAAIRMQELRAQMAQIAPEKP